jgi:hypothetical protein
MRRRSGVLAIILCSAGLLATAPGSPAAALPGRTFAPSVTVDRTNTTGEPSVAVAPDGGVYVIAPDGPGARLPGALGAGGSGGSLVWRSDDGGAAWRLLGSSDVPTGGGDSDIAIARNGTIFASGLSYAACSTVSVSKDRGETFVPVPVAGCGQVPLSNDRQWNDVDGTSTLYTTIGDTVQTQIDLIRSSVVSSVTVPSVTMRLSTTSDYQWPGTVAVDQRDGTTYTVWNTTGEPNDCDDTQCTKPASSTTPDRVLVSVLPRGSMTPPAPTVVASRRFDTFDSFVVDTIDRAGTVYVVWSERHPATQETWTVLSSSTDAGRHWSAPVKVNAAPRTTTFPWVSAGDAGRIAISYYGTTATASSPQRVAKTAPWQVWSSFSTDGGRTFREYRTTGVMNRGQICTSGTDCSAGGRNLLDFFETASDAHGCLLTAFTDNSTGTPYISFVRQAAGPGLHATACAAQRVSTMPTTPRPPTVVRHLGGSGAGSLAATGLPVWLPLLGLLALGAWRVTRSAQ